MTAEPGSLALGDDELFVKPGEQILKQPILDSEERAVIQSALMIGQKSETVEVFGHMVEIRTLNVDLELQISQVVKSWEGTSGFAKAYKTASVAAAIHAIDGVPFHTPLSPAEDTFLVASKFTKLKVYYPSFVDEIYIKLLEMEQGMKEILDKLGKSKG